MATRTQQLAQAKPNRLRYPDRRSVYWLDKLPPEKTGPTTEIELTPRWSELCRNKKFYAQVTYPFMSPPYAPCYVTLFLLASFLLLCFPLQPGYCFIHADCLPYGK
ncbi:theg spermatid protein [Thunnus maccoyii]|uniref:theg spermatid protein n=1 Tax=Thunnus maccoyii TaxID=8240 RepID=UPI001C4B9CD6|nr:theg spermatid protein [Thunnus maccoyii]